MIAWHLPGAGTFAWQNLADYYKLHYRSYLVILYFTESNKVKLFAIFEFACFISQKSICYWVKMWFWHFWVFAVFYCSSFYFFENAWELKKWSIFVQKSKTFSSILSCCSREWKFVSSHNLGQNVVDKFTKLGK